jgi:hypothetical protein
VRAATTREQLVFTYRIFHLTNEREDKKKSLLRVAKWNKVMIIINFPCFHQKFVNPIMTLFYYFHTIDTPMTNSPREFFSKDRKNREQEKNEKEKCFFHSFRFIAIQREKNYQISVR